MIFRSKRGFWHRRGIKSTESDKLPIRNRGPVTCYCVCHTPVSSRPWCVHCRGDNEVTRSWGKSAGDYQDTSVQRLHDLNRELADYEAETGAPPRPPVRDTPPSEEEGRQ